MIILPPCAHNLNIEGMHQGPGSSLVSVKEWILPSTSLNRCVFLKHIC